MPFECNFTEDVLKQMLPKNREYAEWFYYLNQILPDYEITTALRVAAFMAQCSHESGEFTVLQENLNYSADGLQKIFRKYFPTPASTQGYVRQPEKIANRVYGSRMGNGPETSGDGWRYRGRGIIQLTGRDNYSRCSQDLYEDDTLIQNPDKLCTKDGAIYSACWFWWGRGLNDFADAGDMLTVTRRINGGTIGIESRMKHYNHYLNLLK